MILSAADFEMILEFYAYNLQNCGRKKLSEDCCSISVFS